MASNLCVDTRFHNQNENFGLETCIKDNPHVGGEQVNIYIYSDTVSKTTHTPGANR